MAQYLDEYDVAAELRPGGDRAQSLRDGARIELGLRRFLVDGGFIAFTDTFEDLHGLKQLPGLAVQRLMADGYGFGGEGDWKTAAMVRAMKVMSAGLPGGTSFMEDYTYHLTGDDDLILGAHMLEVCPSIAGDRPRLEVHPLSIGGKEDPVRLVFDAHPGPAVAACITDMGQRFRMVATVVDVVPAEQPLPKLPVARAIWRPRPDLRTGAAAWIYAGGSHHTSLGFSVTAQTSARLRRDVRGRAPGHRREDHARRLPRPAPVERSLLAAGEGALRRADRHPDGPIPEPVSGLTDRLDAARVRRIACDRYRSRER